MSTCKDCKHWNHEPFVVYYGNGLRDRGTFGDCMAIKAHNMEDTECSFKDDPESVLNDADAFTSDGSLYQSCLNTGPDFGCNKWEPKA
jgi:hypothetical protein